MAKKVFTPEQIISNLREAEVLISQGQTITAVHGKVIALAGVKYQK